jgi:acyl carrier protein
MTFEKVALVLADYKGIDVATIKPESTFAELEFDSLDVAEIAMKLEDEFSMTIELDASDKTVQDLVNRIEGSK